MPIQTESSLLTGVGIDLGTRYAALVVIKGNTVKYATLLRNPTLLKLWHELDLITNQFELDYVSCEKPYYHKNARSAFMLYEQLGVIKLFCQKKNINLVTLSPSTIKKLISGSGNASKNKISQLIKIRLHDPDNILITGNFDLTDAASIALAASIKKNETRFHP